MKKTMKKILALGSGAVLLVSASVMGTMAYLTSTTTTVKNTFTVGNVAITLDEADVKTDGTYETNHEARVTSNEYKLMPGHTYFKDPTVTVKKGSEESYVRMIVTVSDISALKNAFPANEYPTYYDGEVFLLQQLVGGWDNATWIPEGVNQEGNEYEFRYKEAVGAPTADVVLDDLFETITIPGTIDNEKLANLQNVEISVVAHAIQKDGFESADAAWNAWK